MNVRRLSWAGIEISYDGRTVLVDCVENADLFAPWGGPPSAPFVKSARPEGNVDGALITHVHTDHFDPPALVRLLGDERFVLCPDGTGELVRQAAEGLTGTALTAREVGPWERAELCSLRVTAVPAVDGLGDEQLSWLVTDGEVTIGHFGDTVWHGHWWNIRERCGPIDVAFLPINAALVNYPHRQPASGIPAVLTPEQAVAAAEVMQVKRLVPIHYGLFHAPGLYIEREDAEAALLRAAAERNVAVHLMAPGEEIELRALADVRPAGE